MPNDTKKMEMGLENGSARESPLVGMSEDVSLPMEITWRRSAQLFSDFHTHVLACEHVNTYMHILNKHTKNFKMIDTKIWNLR